jgi:hypothetical protein
MGMKGKDIMGMTRFSEIEQKVVDFLRNVDAPNLPSHIAPFIYETREDTTAAVLELERKGILYRERDTTFFFSTGEVDAFSLKRLN